MASHGTNETGPDLAAGVAITAFGAKSLLQGHVAGEPVVLARVGDDVLAVGGMCTHYGAPLAHGVVVGDTVRCPWHHACFSLRTGEALQAPAFDPLPRWKVERQGDRIFVTDKIAVGEQAVPQLARDVPPLPERIVIVGGGAAGFAAAEMLRRRHFSGELTMLSADTDAPYDRPNLSKDYLAGSAKEAWIPLRSQAFYTKRNIGLHLQTNVDRIDTVRRSVITDDGRVFPFDRLLLATGAEPIRLSIPGAEQSHVFVLRSLNDSRAIIARAGEAKVAVVLGAGFIGLEVAAALRSRNIAVHVVAPGARPLETVLGPELGDFIRSLHEQHGVAFHLGATAVRIDERTVTLSDGRVFDADLVVVGVGVKPQVVLAAEAGIAFDKGVLVNEFLETNIPGIFAAGDVAQWHDLDTRQSRRVEHWVVAQRQGQVAAENMLGVSRAFQSAPFFWSAHYDLSIRYVGYAHDWDRIEIDGSMAKRDCMVRYIKGDKVIAVAAIGRDIQALEFEASMGWPRQ
ncbi:FAD-dependent oxidoreductase [Rhizobium sp. KVB221]|uniref:FAD-dependent oxidoreductase n=1 Tax=Rhizobium setariae TaxID=2801340 RepID=A0A936YNF0_9HYPH|nr:FAD-dependent oxidoreductase [Rhizobium setariae]MBL0373675.1 FAD-dependent oxidoreductase [Rhizobium setariae]